MREEDIDSIFVDPRNYKLTIKHFNGDRFFIEEHENEDSKIIENFIKLCEKYNKNL